MYAIRINEEASKAITPRAESGGIIIAPVLKSPHRPALPARSKARLMIINKNVARLTPRNEDYRARSAVLSLRTRFKKLTHFANERPNALLDTRRVKPGYLEK